MTKENDSSNLQTFADELGKLGLKLFKEIYGQTYLEEEDLHQRIGHLFLKKNYPVLREVGLPKKVFDVTFKKGEFPDFIFFDDVDSKFSKPFIIEFKHDKKITDQHRAQLGRQLNLAQDTIINKSQNLKYGFVWNIIKTDFSIDSTSKFEEVLSDASELLDKSSTDAEKNLIISTIFNLYILEFNFFTSTKEARDKVVKKIKKLMQSEEFLNMDYSEFSKNFVDEFEKLNSILNPKIHNSTMTNGVFMNIKKPEVKVEVELWRLNNGNNHELGIELVQRKTYG